MPESFFAGDYMTHDVRIIIDGHRIAAEKGATILEVALRNNIYIPHLCYYPGLKPKGACRLCMVEIDGKELVTACRTEVEDGMVINTWTPKVERVVRPIAELLIANHHATCKDCPGTGKCELQKIRAKLKIQRSRVERLRSPQGALPIIALNRYLDYDPNKCVCCGICIDTCSDINGTGFLYFVDRGYSTKVAFFGDESKCESCMKCAMRCPVGVLIPSKR